MNRNQLIGFFVYFDQMFTECAPEMCGLKAVGSWIGFENKNP